MERGIIAQLNRLRKNTRQTLFLTVHYDEKLLSVLMDLEWFSFYFISQRIDEYVPQRHESIFKFDKICGIQNNHLTRVVCFQGMI